MQTDSSNFKVDPITYVRICKAVYQAIVTAFKHGKHEAEESRSLEIIYKHCTDKIFKLLGGEIEQ